jgi:hypothetical protein
MQNTHEFQRSQSCQLLPYEVSFAAFLWKQLCIYGNRDWVSLWMEEDVCALLVHLL